MKSLYRILLAIISGISTYFAFPIILALVERILRLSIFQLYSLYPVGFIFIFTPCVVAPFPIYYALTCRDAKKIQMPKNTQAIIIFSAAGLSLATFIALGGTSFKGPISLLLWYIALQLNLFFFSTIVLLSLYYLVRAAFIAERQ